MDSLGIKSKVLDKIFSGEHVLIVFGVVISEWFMLIMSTKLNVICIINKSLDITLMY